MRGIILDAIYNIIDEDYEEEDINILLDYIDLDINDNYEIEIENIERSKNKEYRGDYILVFLYEGINIKIEMKKYCCKMKEIIKKNELKLFVNKIRIKNNKEKYLVIKIKKSKN